MDEEARRVRLGANEAAGDDVLTALADDPSIRVRVAVALNPNAPAEAQARLIRDPDERVRQVLAQRLGGLVPTLSEAEQGALRQQAWHMLTALAADQAERVRVAIADAVKDLPDAPKALILRLAHDPSVMVCEPIIQLSPLLSTEDLIALVAAAPSPGTLCAVAGRPDLGEAVSDAIVARSDNAAIQALLANASAAIREATLDALADQAGGHVDWHEPLVRRPHLSGRAIRALSDIVATHWLQVLTERVDLPPDLTDALRMRLVVAGASAAGGDTGTTPYEDALALARSGHLTEETVLQAARSGNARFAAALLAVKAAVPLAIVDRSASLRDAKGLVCLAWKAGLAMRTAVMLQTLLGRMPPQGVMQATRDGGYPLGQDEMEWHLGVIGADQPVA